MPEVWRSRWLSKQAIDARIMSPQDTAAFGAMVLQTPIHRMQLDSNIQKLKFYTEGRMEQIALEKTGHGLLYHNWVFSLKAAGVACGGFLLSYIFRKSIWYPIAYTCMGLFGAYVIWRYEDKLLDKKCGAEYLEYKEFQKWFELEPDPG